jgi:hypothetical protein
VVTREKRALPGQRSEGRRWIDRALQSRRRVHLAVAEVPDELVLGRNRRLVQQPQAGHDLLRHLLRVPHRGEVDQPHPVGERRSGTGRDLQRKPRLAHTAGTGERHQAGCLQQCADLADLAPPAHETGDGVGQVAGRTGGLPVTTLPHEGRSLGRGRHLGPISRAQERLGGYPTPRI